MSKLHRIHWITNSTMKKQDDNIKRGMCMLSNQPKCMDQVPLQNATRKGPHIKVGAPKGQSLFWTDGHKCAANSFVSAIRGLEFVACDLIDVTRICTIEPIGLEECLGKLAVLCWKHFKGPKNLSDCLFVCFSRFPKKKKKDQICIISLEIQKI